MKALGYNGPNEVSVVDVPDARIEQPTDVLVRVTTTNICGSDLHMYEGRTDTYPTGCHATELAGVEAGDSVVIFAADPGAADELARKGQIAFDFGKFWMKGQRMATGQANVKAYNSKLCALIAAGKATPSFIVSHELPLSDAPRAYRYFGARDKGWTKVVLKPGS